MHGKLVATAPTLSQPDDGGSGSVASLLLQAHGGEGMSISMGACMGAGRLLSIHPATESAGKVFRPRPMDSTSSKVDDAVVEPAACQCHSVR